MSSTRELKSSFILSDDLRDRMAYFLSDLFTGESTNLALASQFSTYRDYKQQKVLKLYSYELYLICNSKICRGKFSEFLAVLHLPCFVMPEYILISPWRIHAYIEYSLRITLTGNSKFISLLS